MLAVQLLFDGRWRHAESADTEFQAYQLRRVYRREHGVPTRIVRMENDYETNWRPIGRLDRYSGLCPIPNANGCGDVRRGRLLLLRGMHSSCP